VRGVDEVCEAGRRRVAGWLRHCAGTLYSYIRGRMPMRLPASMSFELLLQRGVAVEVYVYCVET